jgi:hypothetical protein
VLESFTAATFAPFVQTPFGVRVDEEHELTLELVEARAADEERARAAAATGVRTPFSLVFSGPLEPLLPQRIYRLEHERLGTFDLFLVPIGPEDGAMRYQAVFG